MGQRTGAFTGFQPADQLAIKRYSSLGIEPQAYFRDSDGRILKIKDIYQGACVVEIMGFERRLDPSTLVKYLDYYGYKKLPAPKSTPEAVKEIMESNIDPDNILRILSNE